MATRFIILIGASLFATTNLILGQTRVIVGRILDYETQQPIKNANVVILGTTQGTVSNFLGYFELTIDPLVHDSFVASHVGYKTSEIPLPVEDRFKFFLEKEYKQLNLLNLGQYPKENRDKGISSERQNQGVEGMILVESNALYEGGIDLFYDFIGNYLIGKVVPIPEGGTNVLFSIDESGRPIDIEVLNGSNDFIASIKEAFSNMPTWIPATQRQTKVTQHFVLPIDDIGIVENTSSLFDGLYSFISNTMRYPAEARRMGIEGIVFAEFTIRGDGSIESLKILKDIGANCGSEVSRVISLIPTDLLRLLRQTTGFNKFVLPVAYGLQVPHKGYYMFQNSTAYLLSEISVVAVGIEREVRVTGGNWQESGRKMPYQGVPYHRAGAYTFRNLSEALINPKYVTRLELANNGLTSFPPDIMKFKNLDVLDLEKNHLKELPNTFDHLLKLKELYLYGNKVDNLPETFGLLKKITTLSLAANEFNHFPSLICSLKDLELLDISENSIAELPENIGDLKKLKVIILRNNQISKIPESFFTLSNLEQISLEGNRLSAQDIEKLKYAFSEAQLVVE